MKIAISLSKNETDDWFAKLSEKEQESYLSAHPNSHLKKTSHKAKPATRKPVSRVKCLTGETKVVEGVRVLSDGKPLPTHIESLKLPPAWVDVKINHDPSGDLLAQGRDAKGRLQSVYSEAFSKTQAEAKFQRVSELMGKFSEVLDQNQRACRSREPKIKDAAECLSLIMATGIRPGSDDDTGAAKKAYGATTLEARHVVRTKEGVELHFTGKKGVDLKIPVTDPTTVRMLLRRAKEAGADGKLFPQTNDKRLLAHTNTMDGGGFKTKDFRTCLATKTALDEIEKMPKPANDKEYKKHVLAVAKIVSKKLGNTPTIALQSYINPVVFSHWRS